MAESFFPLLLFGGELEFRDENMHLLNLSLALQKRGIPFWVCTSGGKLVKEFTSCGIEVIEESFLRLPFLDFFLMTKFVKRLASLKPKLIHLQRSSQLKPALKISKKLKIPLLLTIYSIDETALGEDLFQDEGVKILVFSEEVRENLVNRHKVPKPVIHLVSLATCVEKVESIRSYEKNLCPVVGTFCQAAEEGKSFLEMAKKVVEQGVEAEFIIAGKVKERRKLEKYAEQLEVLSKITFWETLSHSFDLMHHIHLYVGLQGRRQFGQDLLDAMAWGHPVVALRRGVNFSLVQEGETGFLVPPQDVSLFAQKVVELLKNPEKAEEMGKKGRNYVKKYHNLDILGEEVWMIYERMVKGQEE